MHPTERRCLTKLVAYKDALELVMVLPGERGHTGNCPHPPCVLCGEEPRKEPREESLLCGEEPREESVFV